MTRRYLLRSRDGRTISFSDDIKDAYRAASRINRCEGRDECVEILAAETSQVYSLTCLSRRRAKDHGRDVMNRFRTLSSKFEAYERNRGTITKQGIFAYEMFDMGFSLI